MLGAYMTLKKRRHYVVMFYTRLTILYANMQDIGLNPEHCWELLKIAEDMQKAGYSNLEHEIRNFVHAFNWWESLQLRDVWIRLYSACMDELKLENVLV
jgi:hypothetical protein